MLPSTLTMVRSTTALVDSRPTPSVIAARPAATSRRSTTSSDGSSPSLPTRMWTPPSSAADRSRVEAGARDDLDAPLGERRAPSPWRPRRPRGARSRAGISSDGDLGAQVTVVRGELDAHGAAPDDRDGRRHVVRLEDVVAGHDPDAVGHEPGQALARASRWPGWCPCWSAVARRSAGRRRRWSRRGCASRPPASRCPGCSRPCSCAPGCAGPCASRSTTWAAPRGDGDRVAVASETIRPYWSALRILSSRSADSSIALVGMQPRWRQVPPILCWSMSATGAPAGLHGMRRNSRRSRHRRRRGRTVRVGRAGVGASAGMTDKARAGGLHASDGSKRLPGRDHAPLARSSSGRCPRS